MLVAKDPKNSNSVPILDDKNIQLFSCWKLVHEVEIMRIKGKC